MKVISGIVYGGGWKGTRTVRIQVRAWLFSSQPLPSEVFLLPTPIHSGSILPFPQACHCSFRQSCSFENARLRSGSLVNVQGMTGRNYIPHPQRVLLKRG